MGLVDGSLAPGRVQDWSPLAVADPVPGDAAGLLRLAAQYEGAAQQVGQHVTALRRLAAGGAAGGGGSTDWQGAAASAYRARATGLPEELDLVGTRLLRVAHALRAFAVVLESVQQRALAALGLARSAAAAPQPGHRTRIGPAFPVFGGGIGGGPGATGGTDSPELARARRLLAAACEGRDRAAERCARSLAAAGHDRLRDPSGWQRFLGAVSSWAGTSSAWLGVAALVLCWVPGLGELLGAVSLGLALLGTGADAALAVSGRPAWSGLGIDLLGVLPLGKAARLGAVMSHERAVAQAARQAGRRTRGAAAVGRGLQRLAPAQWFERSRGLHGLVSLPEHRPGGGLRIAGQQLGAAVRSGVPARSLPTFLRSPGGLMDEIAQARRQGPGGPVWLAGGHGLQSMQVSLGVGTSGPPVGTS
jgi:hypothetical protein